MAALVEATIDLIVEQGLSVSVRQIAERAGVNHGLVHAYFGSKDGLLRAAIDAVVHRASADADAIGFPPPDLASRRGGELAKAVARIRLDADASMFSSHPVADQWRSALRCAQPELSGDEIDAMVASASALGLGWALFADHLADTLGLDAAQRAAVDTHMTSLIATLGGIPEA